MNPSLLLNIGLSDNEAAIYSLLLQSGELNATQISEQTEIQRSSVYYILEQLEKNGLIEKQELSPRKTTFRCLHPSALKDYIKQRQTDLNTTASVIDAQLPSIISEYSIGNNKPGVHFFEGRDGFTKALHHSLETKSTMYSYVNSDDADTYVDDIDESYVAARVTKKIHKHIIMPDTPSARAYIKNMNTEYTTVKLIDANTYHFPGAMEIYDTGISYILPGTDLIAFVIQHPSVIALHRAVFEQLWDLLPETKA
jgi:sugar-specific transcriptional regulator TrmB